jgi:hypothetical protein
MCCKVAVLQPSTSTSNTKYCADPCEFDSESCVDEDDDDWTSPASVSKRHEPQSLEERGSRNQKLSPETVALIHILQIALAAYFSRGGYFNPTNGGAPVQGMFRQDAPRTTQQTNVNARLQCLDTNLVLDPMSQQSDLTQAIIAQYNPQTEHPVDVSTNLCVHRAGVV